MSGGGDDDDNDDDDACDAAAAVTTAAKAISTRRSGCRWTRGECAAASVYIARGSTDTVTDSNRTFFGVKLSKPFKNEILLGVK